MLPLPVIVLDGRIQIDSLLCEQPDNAIYGGKDLTTGHEVAVKAESKRFIKKSGFTATTPLQHEVLIAKDLESKTAVFFPRVVWQHEQRHHHLVAMEMMGDNLSASRAKFEWSDYTVLSVGVQMLRSIKLLHTAGYLHLDIKPDNFVIGKTDKAKIYLIDFGHADKFASTLDGWLGVSNDHEGNMYFASVMWHHNKQLFVWDDLESLAYTMAFLKFGDLPWLKCKCKSNDDFELMKKKVDSTEEFFRPNLVGQTSVIMDFLLYARKGRLRHNIPDYDLWIKRFLEASEVSKVNLKQKYEWC